MNKFLLFCCCIWSIITNAQTVGLFYSNPGTADGYFLFAPGSSDSTFLVDKCGKRIHEWGSGYYPGLAVYLNDDGTLLRCGDTDNNQFQAGGQGGIVEKFDWSSNLLWSYKISDNDQCQHHDAIQLPNGNIVAIVWESHTKEDAQANGRVTMGNKMWSEKIIEIQPYGTDSGIIVWQWRAWDHLVQDVDATKLNYGVVADHPELLDINLGTLNTVAFDWLHFNGLDYNADIDQLIVSSHHLNEVYIIDHSTTLEEAASHTGGNSGRGGDFLYRWGNPQNYDRGTSDDKKLFQQHNPTWVSGNKKILVFNNGVGRPGTDYSTVETFVLPAMVDNNYPIEIDSAYEPDEQDWIYAANPVTALFSSVQGSAQRLANGNTLICNANSGEFLEVDSLSNDIWKYVNPVGQNGNAEQGDLPFKNSCFRVTHLPLDHPGLAGQSIVPGNPIEINPLPYVCNNFPTTVAATGSNDRDLIVYPNPFQNGFAIRIPVELKNAMLQIHDVTGRLLHEEKIMASAPQSDHVVSVQLQQGVMIISVTDEGGSYKWKTTAVSQ